MHIDLTLSCETSRSPRARQLEAMFDVPPSEKTSRTWTGDIDLDARPWNVGLIVGPSGSGKTTLARQLFGDDALAPLTWRAKSVIDDFAGALGIDRIVDACQAVGFNTIPAWLRPYRVLSTGERFRVELARRLLELPDPVVVDEFTSTVDRNVARIGAHATQRFARRHDRRVVAVTCHYDIIDWLQPDWILEPATMTLTWSDGRRLRPPLDITIAPVPRAAWQAFAPFHYLTPSLNTAARPFGLWVRVDSQEGAPATRRQVNDQTLPLPQEGAPAARRQINEQSHAFHQDGAPAARRQVDAQTLPLHQSRRAAGAPCSYELVAFAAALRRPHPRAKDIMGITRVVTLPDWQGLGLAFILIDTLGAAYKAIGERLRNYPAHPPFVRAHDRSPRWRLIKRPGTFQTFNRAGSPYPWLHKTRPCAIFEYDGDAMPRRDARRLLSAYHDIPRARAKRNRAPCVNTGVNSGSQAAPVPGGHLKSA